MGIQSQRGLAHLGWGEQLQLENVLNWKPLKWKRKKTCNKTNKQKTLLNNKLKTVVYVRVHTSLSVIIHIFSYLCITYISICRIMSNLNKTELRIWYWQSKSENVQETCPDIIQTRTKNPVWRLTPCIEMLPCNTFSWTMSRNINFSVKMLIGLPFFLIFL